MVELLIAIGVGAAVVLTAEAVTGVPMFSRALWFFGEALWRVWLLLIGVTVVGIAMVLAFEAFDSAVVAAVAGSAALLLVVGLARWRFTQAFTSTPDLGDYSLERRVDGLHEEGWRLLKERQFRAAAVAYRQAAEIGDVDAMVNLATILVDELDASEEAERWYRRAVEAGSTTAAENLGLQRLDEGRIQEARELFELARRGGDSAGYLRLADIAIEEYELERALGLLEIALMEGDLEAYAPLGWVLASLERDAEAEQRLRDGLALGASGVVPVLAHLLRETGREDEADEVCAIHGRENGGQWPRQ